jgi:hypothetical protein
MEIRWAVLFSERKELFGRAREPSEGEATGREVGKVDFFGSKRKKRPLTIKTLKRRLIRAFFMGTSFLFPKVFLQQPLYRRRGERGFLRGPSWAGSSMKCPFSAPPFGEAQLKRRWVGASLECVSS